MAVKLTTTFHLINMMTKFIRLISGSQGASKTYSILQKLLIHGEKNPYSKITCLTDTYPHLRDGMLSDMESIYISAGKDWSKDYNEGKKDLRLGNGSVIQFRNLDNNDLKAGRGPRRHILFINEANRMGYPALSYFIDRTDLYCIFDWNPDEPCWIDEQYIDAKDEDVEHLTVTYLTNEFLPKGERATLEKKRIASEQPGASDSLIQWVRTFVYGLKGSYSERQIYNYTLVDEVPESAKRIPSGMDFGKSPDKTSLVNAYVDGVNLYFDEIFSLNNLREEKIEGDEQMSIVDKMEEIKFPKGQIIVADPSGRNSILDMRKHGYTIVAVNKPPGSVKWGITRLRGFNIHVTRRSKNLPKEMDSFLWKQDPYTGKIIPIPDPKIHEGDSLVSCRYLVMAHFK